VKRLTGWLATIVVVMLAAAALAGCGDDDGGDSDATESTEVEATDDDGGADVDAEDIVLTEDDVPDGFEVNEDAADSNRLDDAIEDCADEDLLDALDEGTASEAEGLDLVSEEDQVGVSSRATVLDDEELATEFFGLVTDGCIGEALSDGFNEDLSEDDFDEFGVTRENAQDLPDIGAEIGGFTFLLEGESDSQSLAVFSEYVVVQQGNAVAFFLFSGIDAPFPSDDEEDLIELVAERMEA